MRPSFLTFLLFLVSIASAQQIQTHVISIPGARVEYYDIANADDSGYYAVGVVQNSRTDGIVTRFDSNGNVLWSQTLTGGAGVLLFGWVTPFPGGAYVCGYHNWNTMLAYGELYKFDSQGNLLWQKEFGSNTSNYGCFSGACNSFGDLFFITYNGQAIDTGFVAKCDASGNLVWSKRIAMDWIDDIFINSGDSLVVCGYAQNGPSVAFMDQNGALLSQSEYYSTLTNTWLSDGVSTIDETGCIYNIGYLDLNGTDCQFMYKLDVNGNLIWSNKLTSLPTTTEFRGISCKNNVIIAVGTNQVAGNIADQLIVTFDAVTGSALNAVSNLTGSYSRWTSVCPTNAGWCVVGCRDSAGVITFSNFMGSSNCNETGQTVNVSSNTLLRDTIALFSSSHNEIVVSGAMNPFVYVVNYSFECPVGVREVTPTNSSRVSLNIPQSAVQIQLPQDAIAIELFNPLGQVIAKSINPNETFTIPVADCEQVILYRVYYDTRVETGYADVISN